MRRLDDLILACRERLRPGDWQRTLVWAALAGILGALATLGFREGLVGIEHLLYGDTGGLVQAAQRLSWWQRLLVPAAGGLLAGVMLLLARRLPNQPRHGDYMEAVVLGRGDVHTGSSLLRALSSACTVASGGAIGREGPMVQLAALAGSWIAHWRGLEVPRRRLMVACAAAAGVATAYNAPVAGALFIAEIVLQSLATETLAPLLVAAVMANVTVAALAGSPPLYRMTPLPPLGATGTLVCAGLGVLAGIGAPVYLWLLDRAKALFAKWHSPLPVRLAAGGLAVGALSIASPQVWGNGFSVVQSLLQSPWAWQLLLLVLLLKVAAIAATSGSGAVGGIFTPTLFVGAVTGTLFGQAMETLLPGVLPVPVSTAIGMGAFLAASTHAPLTSVLMIFEMTENYAVVAPLMLACVLAFSISRVLRPDSIYASSQRARIATDPRLATARELLRPETLTARRGQSLAQVEAIFLQSRWRNAYVVDEKGAFIGAIALHEFLQELKGDADTSRPWPEYLLKAGYPRLQERTPLWEVLGVFESHAGEHLPVLDDAGRLLGHLAKADLLLILRDRLAIG